MTSARAVPYPVTNSNTPKNQVWVLFFSFIYRYHHSPALRLYSELTAVIGSKFAPILFDDIARLYSIGCTIYSAWRTIYYF